MESLFLTIGFVGFVLALLTPYTKSASLVTCASFTLYFYFSGIENWFTLILFVLGLVLIVFEIFIPDFGLAGILGTLFLIGGLYWTLGDFLQMVQDLSMAVIVTTALTYYLFKKGYSLAHIKKLVLKTSLGDSYQENNPKTILKAGLIGKAQTPLRPSGKASFGNENGPLFDVLSVEKLIPAGTPIIIEKVQGNKILVTEYIKKDGR